MTLLLTQPQHEQAVFEFARPVATPPHPITAEEWGIPTLDLAMQALSLPPPVLPMRCGARAWRKGRIGGTVHFYCPDELFRVLWYHPERLHRTGAEVIIEPNFSTFPWTSRVQALYDIYRKRTLARYYQKCGKRIVVDLNVHPLFHDLALLGVPQGWRSYATRCHRGATLADVELEHALAVDRAGTTDLFFVVYGGPKAVREACPRRGWINLPDHADECRGKAAPFPGV